MSRTAQLGWPLLLLVVVACGHDDGGGGPPPGDQTGMACSAPAQCYPSIDQTTLRGTVECLNVQGGYCTHQCTVDTDCCAVPGECQTALVEVCSPFESLSGQRCFISCEAADLARAQSLGVWGLSGDTSDTAYCQHFANPYFGCRASGGGAEHHRICM